MVLVNYTTFLAIYTFPNMQKCGPWELEQLWETIKQYLKWHSRECTGFEVRQAWV